MTIRINPYRKSVTPYRVPLPVPICDPDFNPVSVAVSCQWLSYIVGALSILKEQATWDTDDPDVITEAIGRANDLIAIFAAADSDSSCAGSPAIAECGYTLPASDGGWYVSPSPGFGQYQSGVGFESTHGSGSSQQALVFRKDLSETVALVNISVHYVSVGAGSGANNFAGIFVDGPSGPEQIVGDTLLSGSNTFSFSGFLADITGIEIQMNSGTAAGSTFYVDFIDVTVLAFGSYDC